MNLLEQLQVQKSLTYLFISHDLRAIRHVSDRIAVMYLGKLVEVAAAESVYEDPLMPYTKALISAVPVPDPIIEAARKRIVLQGDVPSPINPPQAVVSTPVVLMRSRLAAKSSRLWWRSSTTLCRLPSGLVLDSRILTRLIPGKPPGCGRLRKAMPRENSRLFVV